jgi:hypothetical protein
MTFPNVDRLFVALLELPYSPLDTPINAIK